MLTMDKHCSLLQTVVKYGRKKYYKIGPRRQISRASFRYFIKGYGDQCFEDSFLLFLRPGPQGNLTEGEGSVQLVSFRQLLLNMQT
jgi:hypothetical protein